MVVSGGQLDFPSLVVQLWHWTAAAMAGRSFCRGPAHCVGARALCVGARALCRPGSPLRRSFCRGPAVSGPHPPRACPAPIRVPPIWPWRGDGRRCRTVARRSRFPAYHPADPASRGPQLPSACHPSAARAPRVPLSRQRPYSLGEKG